MDILTRLRDLRRREHLCTVDLLEALLECDHTRAFLDHGYDSMWRFLVDALRYSNAAASRRHRALKCARKFPVVLEWLRSERVTLCSLEAIAPLLDEFDDAQALLDRIEGKSQAEVQAIVAHARPVDERREVVRREFVQKKVVAPAALFEAVDATVDATVDENVAPAQAPRSSSPPAPQVEERVRVTLSLTPEEFALLERVRMLASRRPGRMPSVHETVVEAARFYVEKKAPKERATKAPEERAGKTPKEQPAKTPAQEANNQGSSSPHPAPTKRSRHIPLAIRDAVLLRDGERCTFVGPTGHRCEGTHHLHIDHIEPFASGGTHGLENLRVLCGAHNGRLADVEFGVLGPDGVAVGTMRASALE